MAFSSFISHSPLPLKETKKSCGAVLVDKGQSDSFPIRSNGAELCNESIVRSRVNSIIGWTFIAGSRIDLKPKFMRLAPYRKSSRVYASWFSGSELASSAFTLGTTSVLPFYTLMVLAPNSDLTKKSMESSVPFVVLGVFYTYLVYLSWTPETVGLIFATKHLLPELTGIGKLFSSELTLASAWIHLLILDLFAARNVFLDGLKNQIETSHSLTLCLFCCPVGIVTHVMSSLKQYPKLPKKVNINFRNSSIAVHGVTECVMRRLEGTFFHLSSNKYGSNVVEKFFQFSDDLHNARIINELLYHPTVAMLLVDPYGNYVMQTLVVSKGSMRAYLVNLIQHNSPMMRNNIHGKKVKFYL